MHIGFEFGDEPGRQHVTDKVSASAWLISHPTVASPPNTDARSVTPDAPEPNP